MYGVNIVLKLPPVNVVYNNYCIHVELATHITGGPEYIEQVLTVLTPKEEVK